MATSKIEWTDASWNPLTGCTKISAGCKNCYAEKMALRLKAMGHENYKNGFQLSLHENILKLPLTWKTPKCVFVNSMSDLFHEDVPTEFILQIFQTMQEASWHVFQILTKRSSRLLELSSIIDWPKNVWMGVSVENSDYKYRIDHLRQTSAKIKFISFEPLLGSVGNLDLKNIDWVIVGGESGPGARPIDENWALNIRDQAIRHNLPFFFKQWGGTNKKKTGRLLQGQYWDQMPSKLSVSYNH